MSPDADVRQVLEQNASHEATPVAALRRGAEHDLIAATPPTPGVAARIEATGNALAAPEREARTILAAGPDPRVRALCGLAGVGRVQSDLDRHRLPKRLVDRADDLEAARTGELMREGQLVAVFDSTPLPLTLCATDPLQDHLTVSPS